MKGVIVLAILAVFLILPDGSDSWWLNRKIKAGWRKLKDKARRVKEKIGYKLITGRREIDDLDLNQDGLLDQSEFEDALGRRDTRDLMNLMGVDDSISLEDFERQARDLDALEEEDE